MDGARDLAGKVAVVTGGGSGIGKASAFALARAGAAVVVADVDEARADEVVRVIESDGGRASPFPLDVTEPDGCDRLMQHAVDTHSGLHVLHANAGVALVGRDGFAPEVDPSDWDRVVAVNLSGVFYCCRAAIPRMATGGGGAIVATASSMSTLPLGGMDAYAASKAGVVGLTKSLAPRCGPLGIRVNAIGPGYVDTPMNSAIWENHELKEAFALGHAGGLQTPEEIADVVVFLAGDAARSLTGALLTCDDGWTAFKQPDLVRRFLDEAQA
jgi:NAD(P)-dependent dehydrogenase (short-subunit alcohol dehydrogenase family)